MNGKKITIIFVIAMMLFFAGDGWAEGQEAGKKEGGKKKYKKFHIDLFGGIAGTGLNTLNDQAEFSDAMLRYETSEYFGYLQFLYKKEYVTYTGGISGKFKEIHHVLPLGGRIKYNVNPWLAFSLGVQYFKNSQTSDVMENYTIRVAHPDFLDFPLEYEDTNEYPGYNIMVEGFSPMLGIHATLFNGRLEGFVTGGPLFARCAYFAERHNRMEYSNGYWNGYDLTVDMEGTGNGIAVEAGARLNMSLGKSITLFVESSYAHMKTGEITGSSTSMSRNMDINITDDVSSTSTEGVWKSRDASYLGDFRTIAVVPEGSGQNTDKEFSLDFSGFRMKMGLSFSF